MLRHWNFMRRCWLRKRTCLELQVKRWVLSFWFYPSLLLDFMYSLPKLASTHAISPTCTQLTCWDRISRVKHSNGWRKANSFQRAIQDVWPLLTTILRSTTESKLIHFNITVNFFRLGHNRSALIYLEKALDLENCMEDSSFKADTHLNMCAVLSQMNRHDLAM